MDSGTLVEWRVEPGDHVKHGDIVAVVDTKKAEIEIEVFEDGVVEEIVVPVGEEVPVGEVIARIGAAQAAAPPPEPVAPSPEPVAPPPAPVASPLEPVAETAAPPAVAVAHHRRVSPLARRLAEALHVDLAQVKGTGSGGAVTKVDVERAAGNGGPAPEGPPAPEAPPPAAPAVDRQVAMRSAIAALMARSKREIPHYYLSADIDVTPAMEWLEDRNRQRPTAEHVLPAVLLAKATALAVREHQAMNGSWTDGAFHPGPGIHLGFAVSLRGGGLIAPAIHDADKLSLDDLMQSTRDLVRRARSGRLRASEMSDSTITTTSLGERGVGAVYGVIYPPQVALVGFGRVSERPWADAGMLGVRKVVTATLSGDHRASNGHEGALLLAEIDARLQHPERL